MKTKQKLFILYIETKQRFIKFFKRIWIIDIKYRWNKNYIPKDEFDKSLDLNSEIMLYMNKKEREEYIINLIRRRNIAHERGLD